MRIFFATDIHGSEVCWRKFLNAGAFHKADVLVMGGDMTGKAMVPIVGRNGGVGGHAPGAGARPRRPRTRSRRWRSGSPTAATTRSGCRRTRSPRGRRDPALVDARFKAEMLGQVERWMALADERLAGKGIRCIVSPANDDIFEIDPIIAAAKLVDLGESNLIDLDGFSLVSTGWANPTPWNTFRELPEDQLRDADRRARRRRPRPSAGRSSTSTPRRTARTSTTPRRSMPTCATCPAARRSIPVGSHAIRDAILEYGPVLSLHGHIHEGRGAVKLGRTLAVNPGSTYEDGVLQAAIVDLDSRKAR